ncbi:MAG: ABC transporter permease [Myxococcota bacterium]
MPTLVRLAWRNLWRSPRRTALTLAATVFAVALTLWTLAMAAGSHERWIDAVVRLYPGHVEVAARGYRENRTLDYGMRLDPGAGARLDALADSRGWAPRLETWALAIPDREGQMGRAAWLVGIDPQRERSLTRLAASVATGRFLESRAASRVAAPRAEVVLGRDLARHLDVGIGDRVILFSTDYYGSQAADRFRVVGTLEVGDSQIDGHVVVLRLDQLQSFLEFKGGLSHVALFADRGDDAARLAGEVRSLFSGAHYEVTAWPELIPDMVQFLELDNLGGWISVGILIVVVGFGILNTVLMAVFERVREFGVLRAIGMPPRHVFVLVFVESSLLAGIGIVIGLAVAIPAVLWLESHPIPMNDEAFQAMSSLFQIEPVIAFSLHRSHLIATPAIIFGVALLAALPPALHAARGRPVDALREI